MKKILVLLFVVLMAFMFVGKEETYATEDTSPKYQYHDDYEYAYVQVIAKNGNNYILNVIADGDWFYVTTNQILYVGDYYIVVVYESSNGYEVIIDIMPIELIDFETYLEVLVAYFESTYGVELEQEDFLYWLSQNEPEFYYELMTQYYGYVYHELDYLN